MCRVAQQSPELVLLPSSFPGIALPAFHGVEDVVEWVVTQSRSDDAPSLGVELAGRPPRAGLPGLEDLNHLRVVATRRRVLREETLFEGLSFEGLSFG